MQLNRPKYWYNNQQHKVLKQPHRHTYKYNCIPQKYLQYAITSTHMCAGVCVCAHIYIYTDKYTIKSLLFYSHIVDWIIIKIVLIQYKIVFVLSFNFINSLLLKVLILFSLFDFLVIYFWRKRYYFFFLFGTCRCSNILESDIFRDGDKYWRYSRCKIIASSVFPTIYYL